MMVRHTWCVLGVLLVAGVGWTACSSDGDTTREPGTTTTFTQPPDGPTGSEAGIMSVRVIALSTTSAIVSWYTFEPSTTQADFGADDSYGTTSPEDTELVTQHFVPLTDLSPATVYHFRVRSTDADDVTRLSGDYQFTTQADTGTTGTDYYVDAAVAASGDGSSWEGAFQTPADVPWDGLAPGDCVNFRAGTYADAVVVTAVGAEGSPVVLKPHGPVLLQGGVQLRAESSFVRLQGFEITTLEPTNPGGMGVDIAGASAEVLDNYVHHTAFLAGINASGQAALVRNNLVYFADGIAIVVSGADNVIEDNDVSHSLCNVAGDADASRFFGERNVMRGNFFHDVLAEDTPGKSPHCDCFQTYAVNPGEMAHDITIENNYCFNICGQMFMGEGILADDTHRNLTFRGNVFERVGAIAFNGGGMSNLVVDHNTFVDTGLGAIAVEVNGGSVTSNLFYRNPYAYSCSGCEQTDYNLIWPYDCINEFGEAHGTYGVDPVLLDPREHVYVPAPSSVACAAGQEGSHVGAYPCDEPTGCWDPDDDGYGRPAAAACSHAEEDCDNDDAAVFPGAEETCNAKDDDCNGLRDEDCPAPEPVLALAFDGTLEDASPSGLEAAWSEEPGSYGTGHTGQAAAMTGEQSPFVVVPESEKLGGMGLLSVSLWAKKNGATGGTLFLKHVCYTLTIGADYLNGYVNAEGGQAGFTVQSGAPIDDTEWHHYLVTYDSRSGTVRLVVDGAELATASTSGPVRYEPCDPRELNIGRDPWGDSFDGLIDEFTVYDAVIEG